MKLDITEELSITLYDFVTTHGIATGSRVLGGYTGKSDYDYIITEQELKTIKLLYPGFSDKAVSYVQATRTKAVSAVSLKFSYSSKTIDIIVVKNENKKEAWKQATISFTKNIKPIADKTLRVKVFECLVDYFTAAGSPF